MKMNIFYTDGATKNNGQYGKQESFTCVTDEDGNVIFNTPIGDKTNIQAEGIALGECVRYIVDNNLTPATIKADSEFWVKVITGKYSLKKPHLKPIRDRLMVLLKDQVIRFEWVPRDKNKAGYYLEHKYERKWDRRKGKGKFAITCPHCTKKMVLTINVNAS